MTIDNFSLSVITEMRNNYHTRLFQPPNIRGT